MSKRALLQQTQEKGGGVIPWREFMRLALYHPVHGYYSQHIQSVGTSGDFTTAPALDTGLAVAVRNWVAQVRKNYPALRAAPFLEIGAGAGQFSRAFLDSAGPIRRFTELCWIVETSKPLQAEQRKNLRGRRVRWFPSVADALRVANGRLILFSNELVDAFPCSRWQWDGTEWMEMGLRLEDNKVLEVLRPASLPEGATVASRQKTFADGQRVETHESWRDWISEWTPNVQAAAMLTIDYGDLVEHLYHRKKQGTLRAYSGQQRLEGTAIYSRFGSQDLTADVNFSDLILWAEQLGWEPCGLQSLADFLQHHAKGKSHPRLEDSQDAGGAFRVLEQTYGLTQKPK